MTQREQKFLEIISRTLSVNSFLGDDCAFLPEFKLCITQDNLIEDVHFSLDTIDPFSLGFKAVSVNVSDLVSSFSFPKYASIGLSLKEDVSESFVEEFYKGVNHAANVYELIISGGDLTKSDKMMISVCALGEVRQNFVTKRNMAENHDVVVVSKTPFGSSDMGLFLLQNGAKLNQDFVFGNVKYSLDQVNHFILQHIQPRAHLNELKELFWKIKGYFAMMDTSDSIADAMLQIANASDVSFMIDFKKIPFYKPLAEDLNYKDRILFGGEDYGLLMTMPEIQYKTLDPSRFIKIGDVVKRTLNMPVLIMFDNKNSMIINQKVLSEKTFNHFKKKESI